VAITVLKCLRRHIFTAQTMLSQDVCPSVRPSSVSPSHAGRPIRY